MSKKCFKTKMLLLASLIAVAVAVVPVSTNAAMITDIQNRAKATHDSLHATLTTYATAFAPLSNKYTNIENGVVTGGFALPAIKNVLSGAAAPNGATAQNTALDNWLAAVNAAAIAAGATPETVQTAYDTLSSLYVREVTLLVFSKMSSVESLYSSCDKLSKSQVLINNLVNNEPNLDQHREGSNEETVINTALAAINSSITAINGLMPNAAFYATLLAKDAQHVNIGTGSLSELNTKLSASSQRLRTAEAQVSSAQKAMREVFIRAAKASMAPGDIADLEIRAQYQSYFDQYDSQRRAQTSALIAKKASAIKLLNQLLAKVTAVTPDNLGGVFGAAGSLAGLINNTIASLGGVDPSVLTYSAILTEVSDFENIKINLIAPLVNSAINFNSAIAREAAVTDWVNLATTPAVVAAINNYFANGTPERTNLDLWNTSMTGGAISALITALGTDQGNVKAELGTLITTPGPLTTLSQLTRTYNQTFSSLRSQVVAIRNQWWKILEKAIGMGLDPNGAGLGALAAETKAMNTYASFEAKRASYKTMVDRIVNARTGAIQNANLVVSLLNNVDIAVPNTKANIAVDAGAIVANLTAAGGLIQGSSNYFDMKEDVMALKRFGISDIFLPALRMVVRYDAYQAKAVLMNTLAADITTRVGNLAGVPAADLALVTDTSTKLNAKVAALGTIPTAITANLTDIRTKVTQEIAGINLGDTSKYDTAKINYNDLNTAEGNLRKDISEAIRLINLGRQQLKSLE